MEHRAPTPGDVLKPIILAAKFKPKSFPSNPDAAVQFWIKHQEAPDDFSERVTTITVDGDVVGFKTPYHDRLAMNLRKFLGLKSIHQEYIIHHIDRGIPWRGDEMWFYQEVIKEHDKMLENPEQYIARAREVRKEVA